MLKAPFATILVISLIAGCASESALVVGETRPADDHTTVKILTKIPDGAEEIAILKASSDSGFTPDYFSQMLKRKTGKRK